ncbi:hypothetical protein BASA83_000076 [Batrachochytrium salamandrivorans]|nr:hypothetical protein BASA83_000076 [Batrachochytrium salamandrivorans]
MANSDISVSLCRSSTRTITIYHILDIRPCSRLDHITSAPILAPILGHQMEHVSKIDRRTTKHGARFRITVPEDRQRNIIQRLERQSKQTHWRIRQNYRHRRPDQPRPTAPPPPLSRQILAVNVANISNKRPAIRHIVRNTRLWAISETCITSSKFALLSLDSMSSSIQPRDLDAEESPSVSHRALVAMNMDILEPPPTTVAERLLLVFGKPSTELFHFDNNHPVLILETGTPTHSAFSALSTRGVMV